MENKRPIETEGSKVGSNTISGVTRLFILGGHKGGGHSSLMGGPPLDSDRCRILHHKSQMGGHTGGTRFSRGARAPPGPPLATPLNTMSSPCEILCANQF